MRTSPTEKFKQAATDLESQWTGSADALFEAKLKLLQPYLPKDKGCCPDCGARKVYNEEFDAHFCPTCNQWLEERCGDRKCSYCSKRPAHPLPTSTQGDRIVKPKRLRQSAAVRLPRAFLDEIIARCERAVRAKGQRQRSALVTPLLVSGVSTVCPKHVQHRIDDSTGAVLFGVSWRSARNRHSRSKPVRGRTIRRRTVTKSNG